MLGPTCKSVFADIQQGVSSTTAAVLGLFFQSNMPASFNAACVTF